MRDKYNCPVEITAEILGAKWRSRILWELRYGARRFGELYRSIPAITKKVLSQTLSDLEAHGLITRTEYKENILKVEYELTDYGKYTLDLVKIMSQWGENHFNTNKGDKRKLI
ncbi:winged helix-turn-helix transcriptional regulator [Pseudoneobacillus sp. C159]